MFSKKLSVLVVGLLAVAMLSFVGSRSSVADPNGGAGDDPGHGKAKQFAAAYGKTYGEWSAKWWQWALEIPAYENPILDPDGGFAHIGQQGKVWFLAGTAGGPAERWVTVPEDKALFFALVNGVWFLCDGEEATELEMREDLAWIADRYGQLECTLDALDGEGPKPVTFSNVMVRTQSPVFEFTVPEDFIWGCDPPYSVPAPGTVLEQNVSGGIWVMIPPLEEGEYVLYMHGAIVEPGTGNLWFETEVTWHLTIER